MRRLELGIVIAVVAVVVWMFAARDEPAPPESKPAPVARAKTSPQPKATPKRAGIPLPTYATPAIAASPAPVRPAVIRKMKIPEFEAIARVYRVEGPGLVTKRPDDEQWYAGGKGSSISPGESVDTRINTQAGLELLVGGRIAMDSSTLLEFGPDSDLGSGSDISMRRGRIRAKFAKQKRGRIRLLTPLGVVGIRGTEFEIDLRGGKLRVVLAEGDLEVALSDGQTVDLEPGQWLEFDGSVMTRGKGVSQSRGFNF